MSNRVARLKKKCQKMPKCQTKIFMPNALKKRQIWAIWHEKRQYGNPVQIFTTISQKSIVTMVTFQRDINSIRIWPERFYNTYWYILLIPMQSNHFQTKQLSARFWSNQHHAESCHDDNLFFGKVVNVWNVFSQLRRNNFYLVESCLVWKWFHCIGMSKIYKYVL